MNISASQLSYSPYTRLIENVKNEILKNITMNIKINNKNKINFLIYELPYYFEELIDIYEKKLMSIENLRHIIWGEIIEILEQKEFDIQLEINDDEEKCNLIIRWKTNFDKYIYNIEKYENLINKYKN